MSGAYYNENDSFAAAWLRELIKEKLIADGEVDQRSIADVTADDVRGFTQCHFFAGIGGWSYALRLAGWPDNRHVWTGSCPCQPFSSAGAQAGGHDSRDLWPTWYQLLRECKPPVVFGEQVEAAIGHGWLDRVCDDLEREGYAVGAVGLPAASVGAFHIRHRLWFVAHAESRGQRIDGSASGIAGHVDERDTTRDMADTGRERCDRERLRLQPRKSRLTDAEVRRDREVGDMGESDGEREAAIGRLSGSPSTERSRGFWAAADWIACRDGKARPVEPGTFPLAYGLPARVGRLRGYGNAIVPAAAQAFIEAYLDLSD